jgi:hypothetical protein
MQLTDTTVDFPQRHVSSSYCMTPNSDGTVLYSPQGLFANDATPLGQGPPADFPIPAQQPGYYVTLPIRYPHVSRVERPSGVSVHIEGDPRPLVTLKDVDVSLSVPRDGSYRPGLFLDQRFWYIPDARLLVQVPVGNDHLILHKVDIEQRLEESQIDYLFVTSRAPLTATPGETFEYQMVVRSKNGGVKFQLSSAPGDMRIDAKGKITWPVPAGFSVEKQQVVVALRDKSGQEVFHSFAVHLPEAAENARAQAARAAQEREAAIEKARQEQDQAMIATLPERGPPARANAEKNAEEVLRRYQQQQRVQKPVHPLRTWTDSDGNQIEAQLTEIFAGFANLRSARGQMYLAPISRLSEEDRMYVGQISAAAIAERKRREAEREDSTTSRAQLQVLGAALLTAARSQGQYPAAYSVAPDGKPLLSWRVHLLPHLGANDLYGLFKLEEPWDSDYNRKLLAYMPSFYRATGSKAADGKTNFLAVRGERSVIVPPQKREPTGNSGLSGRFRRPAGGPGKVSIVSITDGTNNTAVLVEVPDTAAIEWTRPDDWEYGGADAIRQLMGFREGGFYAVLADGKVKFISDQNTPETIRRLFDRADGQPVELK